MIRRPPRSTQSRSSAASDVYKRQATNMQPQRRISSMDLSFVLEPDRSKPLRVESDRSSRLPRKSMSGPAPNCDSDYESPALRVVPARRHACLDLSKLISVA
eukprot:TRINITY_DN1535_c0_g2_i11.p2 TRINITY_DN1535_c0_g2~~TRINITY_DN1535_c0_g2_i11.p2  ORF type:complete len:102 (+),score=36.45 TRINITY_DN1535_c0_g2_i11:81-386(+)